MKKKKGSLTIEAVISFTIYLSMAFLLLTLVKMVLVMTILDNACTETAKTVASSSYVISLLNEQQADIEKKEEIVSSPKSLMDSMKSGAESSVITGIMGGDLKKGIGNGASAFLKDLIGGVAVKFLKGSVYKLKGDAAYSLCGSIVKNYITDCGIPIDADKLILRAVKIPETSTEYKTVHTDNLPLSEDGALYAKPCSGPTATDADFNAGDILICIEYPYEIALPFLPSFSVTLRSTAVEHGWLSGTSSGPSRKEGIRVGNLIFGNADRVWIATGGHGKRYHRENCRTLWTSKQETTIAAAKAMGLTPCGVCHPERSNKK